MPAALNDFQPLLDEYYQCKKSIQGNSTILIFLK